jgi:hypothetical protein
MARRIVTGNNAEGRPYFVSDSVVPGMYLWETLESDGLGADPDGALALHMPATAPKIEPPPGASKCVRVTMQPWKMMKQAMKSNPIAGLDENGFHRTATIDYIMIVDGEVDLLLDEGRTTVRAGDLVVQRNTNHAWHNNTDRPVDFWGVMVSVAALG